jgi:tetratricopeptide (TPR) repeat protein
VNAHDKMIETYDRMPEVLRRAVMVREQLAFALNRRAGKDKARRADRERAIKLLEDVLEERGPNAETCGLLGRIYKDQWDEARKEGDAVRARGLLKKAIHAYVRGFEADWRDAYPGINAVTLLDIEGSSASLARRDQLLPVVRFAVEQKLQGGEPDYWDHATLLELAVLASDRERASEHVADALAAVREAWEPETTARNLRLIRDARAARHEDVGWIDEVIAALEKK